MASTCDILVLGGGVIGASVAYSLARRKPGRIILLERSYLGSGGSGQRAAYIDRSNADLCLAGLVQRSLQAFEAFGDTVGGPAVFTRTGLALIATEADRDALLVVHETLRKEIDLDIRQVTELELLELDSNAHLSEGEIAFLDREAGTIDAVGVVFRYADAARRAGVELCEGVEVQRILVGKGRVTGVETNEGNYECGTLVLAAGAWSPALAGQLGVSLPTRVGRAPLALFRKPPDSGRRGIIHIDRVQDMAFQPGQNEFLVAAALSPQPLEDTEIDSSSEAVSADWLVQARQRLSRRYPALHRAFGRGGYQALAVLTPDALPIVDRLPAIEGAWCASGFGMRDVELAPAIGQVMADLLLGAPTAGIDSAALSLARFEQSK